MSVEEIFPSILVEENTEFARFKNLKPSLSNLDKKYDKRSFISYN